MFILKFIEWFENRGETKVEITKADVYFTLSMGIAVLAVFIIDKVV